MRTLLRPLPFVRPALGRIALGMVAALGAGIVSLVIPLVLQNVVDGALQQKQTPALVSAIVLVIVLGALEAALIALRRWFVLTPGTQVQAAMQNAMYAKLQDLPVAFHDKWQSGQLLSRVTSDLSLIRRFLSFGIVLLVVNVITVVIGLGVLISWSWQLGLLFLACSVPVAIYSYRFEQKYSVIARRSQDQAGDLATAVEESIHGIRVLKAFGRGRHSLQKFLRQADELRETEIEKAQAVGALWLWLLLIPDIAYGLCLLGGLWLASTGELTVGELFAFFATATVLRFPIESLGFLTAMALDTRAAVDRSFEIFDEPNPIVDPESPRTVAEPRGRLEFRGARFRYQDAPAGQRDLLDGIDLVLEPGETMALVGITGSGKTTLTALATRLYDVTGGAVLLDGVDVRDLTREELRRRIAMAFEDATLFSASVRDNVLLGRPDLVDDSARADAVLEESLDIAQADFVAELPDGADTRVGEEGLSLSGGQRQRLALARAVAARPSVLVLDDPLSALDVDTEARVEEALRRILSTTTALIVAHRPSTVMLADRVALLQDGRITAIGRHSELLAANAHYRHVISSLDEEARRDERGVRRTLPELPLDTDTITIPGGGR